MDIITDNLASWSFVILGLLALVYTMIVIKEEKKSYLESAEQSPFLHFLFPIPSWWTKKVHSEHHISFERTDTRYEWKAEFQWFPSWDKNLTLEEEFSETIQKLELKFDKDSTDIKSNEFFEKYQDRLSIARVEGTATKSGIHRRYMDLFMIRDHEKGGYLLAKSESSILNGLVEGPYFEEVMLSFSLEKTHEAS